LALCSPRRLTTSGAGVTDRRGEAGMNEGENKSQREAKRARHRQTDQADQTDPTDPNENAARQARLRPSGGYRKLRSFQVTTIIYDATVSFCDRFMDRRSRTVDQMVQAARSGRQNIAEGSRASATSTQTELRLTHLPQLTSFSSKNEGELPEKFS